MNLRQILAFSALLPLALVWTAFAQDPNAATELHLRGLDAQWSKIAGTKDVDKTISYYAEDAMVFPPNGPVATTKDAIRKIWKDLLEGSGSISWRAAKVEVAKSGDLAYVTGSYEASMKDSAGKTVSEVGKYVEVFKKQADDRWKCIVDIWNSDMPATSPAPEKK